jgi:hypothetical protein
MVSEVYYFCCNRFGLEMVSSSSFKGLRKISFSWGSTRERGGSDANRAAPAKRVIRGHALHGEVEGSEAEFQLCPSLLIRCCPRASPEGPVLSDLCCAHFSYPPANLGSSRSYSPGEVNVIRISACFQNPLYFRIEGGPVGQSAVSPLHMYRCSSFGVVRRE